MHITHLEHIPRIMQRFVEFHDNTDTKPSLIKIGAHDGITGDPLGKSILTSEHWTAHLVEPVPELHALLNQNYSDKRRFKCHAFAIGSGASSAIFYSVDPNAKQSLPDLPHWYSQLGSFVAGHIEKWLGDRIKPFIRATVLPQVTLSDFMSTNRISCPTLLHIDTEGLDYEILKTYDFASGRPRAIIVEHKHLREADKFSLLDTLSTQNYSLVVQSQSDFAAFRHAEDALAACVDAAIYHPRPEPCEPSPSPENATHGQTITTSSSIAPHPTPPRVASGPEPQPVGAVRRKRRDPAGRIITPSCPPDMGDDFERLYKKCRAYSMVSAERMFALFQATRYTISARIPGAFVECGVWRGGSMMMIASTLMRAGFSDRELYLFDTFEGMPKPDETRDVDWQGRRAIEEWRHHSGREHGSDWALASLEEVRTNLATTGYPMDRIHMIKGMVEETIPSKAPSEIALLRLDTDWYSSTRHELEHLYPRLAQGGVLIIDDYGHFQGARQATDEYFACCGVHGLFNRIDYTGRLLVKPQIA